MEGNFPSNKKNIYRKNFARMLAKWLPKTTIKEESIQRKTYRESSPFAAQPKQWAISWSPLVRGMFVVRFGTGRVVFGVEISIWCSLEG